MADRSAAEVFGIVFELLAEKPSRDRRDLAAEIYEYTKDYDFEFKQMGVDEALIDLELAEKCDQCGKMIYLEQEHLTEDCE